VSPGSGTSGQSPFPPSGAPGWPGDDGPGLVGDGGGGPGVGAAMAAPPLAPSSAAATAHAAANFRVLFMVSRFIVFRVGVDPRTARLRDHRCEHAETERLERQGEHEAIARCAQGLGVERVLFNVDYL
jgi:hypothetical protein